MSVTIYAVVNAESVEEDDTSGKVNNPFLITITNMSKSRSSLESATIYLTIGIMGTILVCLAVVCIARVFYKRANR